MDGTTTLTCGDSVTPFTISLGNQTLTFGPEVAVDSIGPFDDGTTITGEIVAASVHAWITDRSADEALTGIYPDEVVVFYVADNKSVPPNITSALQTGNQVAVIGKLGVETSTSNAPTNYWSSYAILGLAEGSATFDIYWNHPDPPAGEGITPVAGDVWKLYLKQGNFNADVSKRVLATYTGTSVNATCEGTSIYTVQIEKSVIPELRPTLTPCDIQDVQAYTCEEELADTQESLLLIKNNALTIGGAPIS